MEVFVKHDKSTTGLLDAAATAEQLGCTERMVRKLTRERRLSFVRIGRLVRFRQSTVDAFIDANTVDSQK
jgi:excisionase family DNA binding protein